MTPGGFSDSASAVLTLLSAAVPFPMLMVSRKSGEDYVVLGAYDRQYGLVQGDVLPWSTTLCSLIVEGQAPQANPDVSLQPVLADAAAALRMEVGAWITVPMRGPTGELYGTVCAGDPERRTAPLNEELDHMQRAARVLAMLLEQQMQLDQAVVRSKSWEQAATRDLLTGLGSRRLWEERLPDLDARCTALGSRAAVLVLDLDGLKDVNDLLGHAAGDALLRSAGEVLRTQFTAAHLLARTGGDEFAAVLVELDDASAHATAEAARAALAEVDIEVSIGVCIRTAEMSLEQAWHLADSAMYVDKLARARASGTGRAARSRGHRSAWVSPESSAARQESIAGLLREVREALDLPVAFVSRFHDGQRVIEIVDGSCPVPVQAGDSHPSELTYCQAIVDGALPQAIPNTSAHPFAVGLAVTQQLSIGSYVGVPIVLSDGAVYGTLCAYANEAREVDERDTALLHLVARTIGMQLSVGAQGRQEEYSAQARIREVLEDDLLTTAFQPVVDVVTGSTVSVEALTRFPTRFGRRPDEWFADATQVGRAIGLELAAAEKAVAGLRRLPAHVKVAVNVSAAVAVSAPFIDWLMSSPLDRMVLELTEHEQVEDYAALNEALQPARDRGLRLAVDDAGAGYASMRHWLMLRPDLLKLDLSLVKDVDSDTAKRALCQAVITFAHSTGMRVVAEGVETQAEYDTVRELGVDCAQGYLLQRPVPVEELTFSVLSSLSRAVGPVQDVVGRMRDLALVGCSPATIAARLNALGERRPGGARWHRTSVAEALGEARPAPALR